MILNLQTKISKKTISFIAYYLYFFSIPIAGFNQFTYWLVIILGPFLFINNKFKIQINTIGYIFSIIIVTFLVLLTGFLSGEVINPLKKTILLASIAIASFLFTSKLKDSEELILFYKSIILSNICLVIILFITSYKGGLLFEFVYPEKFGKNLIAPILLVGLITVLILDRIKRIRFFWWFFFIFLISIIMTTSIKVIIPAIYFFCLNIWLRSKNNISFLSKLFSLLLLIIFLVSVIELDSVGINIIISRILILIGLTNLAPYSHLAVTAHRENLIEDGINIFKENPVFGIGLENTRNYIGTYTHNTFIELLAGGGIFVLLFFIIALLFIFVEIIKVKEKKMKLLVISIFLMVLFIAQAQRIYDNRIIMIFLVSLMSIPDIYNNINNKYEK